MWTSHHHPGRLTWVSDGRHAQGIAVDARGVHPRLDRDDHAHRTCLATAADVDEYLERRPRLDAPIVAVMRVAAVALRHLRGPGPQPCQEAA